MEESESKTLLVDAYLKLHIASMIIATISALLIGVLVALMVFLISIYVLAAAVYILDFDSLKIQEIVEKMLVNQIVASRFVQEDKTGFPKV